MGAEEGGGAFSDLKELSLLMVSGIFLPAPALHMCLCAGGCKLCFRRHNQPQQDPKVPAARLPVRPLAEIVVKREDSAILIVPTRAIPTR